MAYTIDELFKITEKFLAPKGYNYIDDYNHDGEYSRFYFKSGNNPIELQFIIESDYDAEDNPDGTPINITFYSASSNAELSDYTFNHTAASNVYNLDTPVEKSLEKMFKEFETKKLNDLAPGLCEYIMDNYNDYAKVQDHNIDGEMASSLFAYCDMMDEYIEWVTRIGADDLLPQTAKDVFLF